MKKIKLWFKRLFCVHLWDEKKIKELKRIKTHPLDDVLVLNALEKKCLKCNKQKIVGMWHRELPDFMRHPQNQKDINHKINKIMTTLLIITTIIIYLIIGRIIAEKYEDWINNIYIYEPEIIIITIFWPLFLIWIIITRIANFIIKILSI